MGMKGKVTFGAIVGVAIIAAVSANAGTGGSGAGAGGDSNGKSSSASAQHSAKGAKGSGAKEGARKKAAFSGDGDFRVGADIKPGTYRTTGNSDGLCYWERAKDAKGQMDSILANDNVSGTSYVTVKATDKLFKSHGCEDWEAVDPKAEGGAPATHMAGDGGMFKVGSDVAPGTYRSTGNSDGCYWERAKDAGHSIGSIIANNNVTGSAVVTISASDAYFKTTGCQDWKKTG
jgi:hypothetical protein